MLLEVYYMSEMGLVHYTLITLLKGGSIAILIPKMELRHGEVVTHP